jgi:hypothetical protein
MGVLMLKAASERNISDSFCTFARLIFLPTIPSNQLCPIRSNRFSSTDVLMLLGPGELPGRCLAEKAKPATALTGRA